MKHVLRFLASPSISISKQLSLLIFFAVAGVLHSQGKEDIKWSNTMGTYLEVEYSGSHVIDGDGNIYLTGAFFSKTDFDPGLDTFFMKPVYGKEIFISKISASGSFLWAKQFKSKYNSERPSICIDRKGHLLVTGVCGPWTDLDPGPEVYVQEPSGQPQPLFIAKLDRGGNFIWGEWLNGMYNIPVITTDNQNNILISGDCRDIADFDPSPATYTVRATYDYDQTFITKLNENGQFLWGKLLDTNSYYNRPVVEVNSKDEIYIMSPNKHSSTLRKFSATGNEMWKKNLDGYFPKIQIGKKDQVFMAGNFSGTVDFDPGAAEYTLSTSLSSVTIGSNGSMTSDRDIFVSALDDSGNFLWAKSIASRSDEFINSFYLSDAGTMYMSGIFTKDTDFDPGKEIYQASTERIQDVYIATYNQNLELLCARAVPGHSSSTIFMSSLGIDVDGEGNIYTAAECVNTTAGIFLSKFSTCGNKVSVPQAPDDEGFLLFPNPSSGEFNLKAEKKYSFTVFDTRGRLLQTGDILKGEYKIDLSQFSSGIYLLNLTSEDQSSHYKLLVE